MGTLVLVHHDIRTYVVNTTKGVLDFESEPFSFTNPMIFKGLWIWRTNNSFVLNQEWIYIMPR